MKNNDEEKGANKTDDRKEEEIKGKLITRFFYLKYFLKIIF